MVEDVPLARALHKSCEIGQEMPAELFQAVARVLALVMSLKRRGSAAGLHRSPAADPPPLTRDQLDVVGSRSRASLPK